MSNEDVLHSNELTIRFDQTRDGQITWHIFPDKEVHLAASTPMEQLAEADTLLCTMGIRALYSLFAEEFIDHALEKANIYLWKERLKRQIKELSPLASTGETLMGVVR